MRIYRNILSVKPRKPYLRVVIKIARVGFDLGALALQGITLTPTPPRIC